MYMEEYEKEAKKKFNTVKPTCKKMTDRYLSLVPKILVSHSDVSCYVFMMICSITNGGYFFLFYPIVIFGHAFI